MDRAKINKPLLVVLGTTGVGKSQLGIELARAVDGEVINADSMQVYKGLDIVTNKATMQERQGVPHHLMDFLDPSKEYSVSDFDRDASRAISDIHSRGKVPILVGGTNYYIQSLLWREQTITKAKAEQERLLAEEEDSAIHSSVVDHPLAGKMTEALTATNPRVYSPSEIGVYLAGANLWDLLKEVDPVMADRWHERHGRKIRRSIQVFYTTGRKHSELIAEQWRQKTSSGSALRHDTCVFWLHAPPAILNPRLDARVDQMIERGLFQELSEMRADVRRGDVIGAPQDASIPTINYTRGILQAIGFKEFDHYLTLMDGKASGSEAQPQPEEIAKARAQGLEDMKCATRQYARKQVSWIKNKLAISCLNDAERPSAKDAHSMCFFLLDASPLSDWTATVAAKAIGLTKSFLNGEALPNPRSLVPPKTAESLLPSQSQTLPTTVPVWTKFTCPSCVDLQTRKPRVLNGQQEWDVHLSSKGHRQQVARSKRREGMNWPESRRRQAKHASEPSDSTV